MKRIIFLTVAALMTFSASAAVVQTTSESIQTQKKEKKVKEIKEVTFHVHLHCANCVKKVEENIAFEKGVKGLEVSLEDQTVKLKYDASKTSEETLKAAIVKLGYEVLEPGAEHHHHQHQH